LVFLLTKGSAPYLFLPLVPSGIKKNNRIKLPINGIKPIKRKKPDLFVSWSLRTPTLIAGIRVTKAIPKKR